MSATSAVERTEGAGTLRPRPRALKPARASVPPGYERSQVIVKFQDNLDLDVDASGIPGSVRGDEFRSARARNVLRGIRELGGVWRKASGMDRGILERLRARAQIALGREIADLASYFTLRLPASANAVRVMDELNSLAEVELASPAPLPTPPPSVPDFEPLQGYLAESPGGLDAHQAWSIPGGTGEGVSICDMEWGWNLQHQDLPPATVLVPDGESVTLHVDDHGTEVLGTMFSLPNGWGTTGASYGARCFVAPTSLDSGYGLFQQILWAASQLEPGDVILIEVQTCGPYFRGDATQFGMVPIEWEPAIYNAILTAVGNGIHVVEPAGNGNQNLDDDVYAAGNYGHAPFTPGYDSGAIMVGAGIPPTAPELGPDRSRSSFSNYGSRLDVQAWGHRVTTTGAGDLYSEEGPNRTFTRFFGGTSSAGPLVASAVASIQGIVEHATGAAVSPAIMRSLLRETGTPQRDGTRPAAQEPIGPRPDLRAAVRRLSTPIVTAPPTVRVFAGETLRLAVDAADLDGETLHALTADPLPSGATFMSSPDHTHGALLWSPTPGQEGSYTIVFSAANADMAADTTEILVESAERGPIITGPVGDIAIEAGPPLRMILRASDPNGDPIIRFEGTNLPRGATFTPDSSNTVGELHWVPDHDQAGLYVLTFRAVSASVALGGQEQTDEAPLVIRVQNNDRAVIIEAPQQVRGSEGQPLTVVVTAEDEDGDAVTSLGAEDLPPGAEFTAEPSEEPSYARGALTWTPSFEQAGWHFFRFHAVSGGRTSSVQTFVDISNTDRPPEIESPVEVYGTEGSEIAFEVTASDPDGDTIGAIEGTGLPSGSQLSARSPGSSRFSWTPSFGDAGDYSMRFRVRSSPPLAPTLSDSVTVAITVEGGTFHASVAPDGNSIRLVTGRSRVCLQVEATNGAFDVGSIDPETAFLSTGPGNQVQPVADLPDVGDRDRDGLPDINLCFSREDLRRLFHSWTSKQTAVLELGGELPGGGTFAGSVTVDVDPQRGMTHAAVSPNPSRNQPSMSFHTSAEGPARLMVYDVRGAVVTVALDERMLPPGYHDVDVGAARAGRLPSGVYYYKLETADGNVSGRFILLK